MLSESSICVSSVHIFLPQSNCTLQLKRPHNDVFFFRYGRWVTRRVAVGTIATIWLLAALISFVPISLGLHRPAHAAEAPRLRYPTCALDLSPSYAVVSSCISFYVPCIVMIGIYCRYENISELDIYNNTVQHVLYYNTKTNVSIK